MTWVFRLLFAPKPSERNGMDMNMHQHDSNESNLLSSDGSRQPEYVLSEWERANGANADEKGAPAGAPAERTDAPVPERFRASTLRANSQHADRSLLPNVDGWREPIFSQTQDTTTSMYSPGIYVHRQGSRKRSADDASAVKDKHQKMMVARFLSAMAVVLACTVFSAAATFGIMEYRFRRGDFTIVNEVVLGGSSDAQENSGLSAPVASAHLGMSAEDIYVMACTQVVSIKTGNDSINTPFSGIVPNAATTAVGSGFIISSDGYILTNFHVIEMAYHYNLPLTVCLIDGTEYEASIVGYDRNNDVAVISVKAIGLTPAILGNSDNINVGQAVYAVGNPLGELVYTMTDGIVSARDREVTVEGKIINTFQFSAAVNSGNSGGPLYDSNGEVIGIVTAKPLRASVEGIGFAIPINDAIEIATELIEHGYITGRPFIGIEPQTVTNAHAEFYGWGVVGVLVKTVFSDSAAEKAGLRIGDIIIGLGDDEVDSIDTLRFSLRKYRAGEEAVLTVWRNGEEVELGIVFDEDVTTGQARPN